MSSRLSAYFMDRAGRSKRPARFMLAVAASISLSPLLATPVAAKTVAAVPGGQSISDFYSSRGDRPVWFGSSYNDYSAALALVRLLKSADADGLDPAQFPTSRIERALADANGGSFKVIKRADRLLSEALVDYARALRRSSNTEMLWADTQLRPEPQAPRTILNDFANAEAKRDFIANLGWMNPIYAGLRNSIAQGVRSSEERALLRLNLERARVLPQAKGKYIIVNATAQRLNMFEGSKIVDSMRVVVGKPVNATPTMAALIRYTSLNPYWNVPPDLAAERIAPNVVRGGLSYLKAKGYEVLSSWGPDAEIIDPKTIDWKAVADGKQEVRLRQLPGPDNAMGQMKFMFPSPMGVYLHDTPQKELLTEDTRMFSGGCIRLEDAPRLARWLYGRQLKASGPEAEQRVDLKDPVPVYITYLTAMPDGGRIAHYPDVYGRDRKSLAHAGMVTQTAGRD